MADFTFGDLICYRGAEPHDGPLLFVAFEPRWNTIAILDVSGDGHIEHKDPAMWRRCDHLGGFAPGIRDVSGTLTGVRVLVGGRDVTDEVTLEKLTSFAYQVTAAIDGPFEIRYGEVVDG